MRQSSHRHFRGILARLAVSAAVVLAMFCPALMAQSDNASLTGLVADSSQAVVINAKIVATNVATNLRFTTSSNSSGYYTIPALPPGPYRVEAEMPGFKRFVRENVVLEARRVLRLDISLELGQVSESVTVSTSTPIIETETSSFTENRTKDQLDLLPKLSTTEIFAYLVSMPGVANGYPGDYLYSISGATTAQYDFAIDGISNRGEPMGGAGSTLEMVSELQLHSVNNSAEFGSPATFSQVSKGGTNELHGQLAYYHSNSALNARNFFAVTKPSSKSHEWGVSLNGPVFVPKLYNGRNRTFFMFAWHAQRTPGYQNANTSVPTLAMRQGDFSKAGRTIKDPLNGQPFPGNQIPSSRLDPVALRVQDRFYPTPNFGSPDLLTLNRRMLFRPRSLQDRIDVRLDQKLSERNLLFARWGTRLLPQHPLESALGTLGIRDGYRRAKNSVLSDTHTFSPSIVNEFRYGYRIDNIINRASFFGLEVLKYTGIQGTKATVDARGMPGFSISGMTGVSATRPYNRSDSLHQWLDNVTVVRGPHTFKMGADIQRHACCLDWDYPTNYFGSFSFTGMFSGYGYSDFLLGLPRSASRGTPREPSSRQQNISSFYQFYFQDDYKVTRNLTLNLGARYEYAPSPADDGGLLFNFDPATGNLVVPDATALARVNPLLPPSISVVTADKAGFPRRLRYTDKNNLVPRVGFAYKLSPKSVVRGGYGIFVDALRMDIAPGAGAPVFAFSETFTNYSSTVSPSTYRFPNPFGAAGAIGTVSPKAVSKNLVNPYIQQWNLTLEREIANVGFRLAYIGTKSTKLGYYRDVNVPPPSATEFSDERRPFPQYRSINLIDNGGNQIYHGLQLEAQRRMATGLFFQSSWTWAKTIADVDDADDDGGGSIENPWNRRAERAPQGYSFKHRWSTSVVYQLPFGKGRRFAASMPLVLDRMLGGWDLGSILYFQTGMPFTPSFSGYDPSGIGLDGGRPDRLRDGNLPAGQRTLDRWFDVGAFAIPGGGADSPVGRFGNSGRNVLVGPGMNVQHLDVMKRFPVREKMELQLAFSFFNLPNHPGFALPDADITSANAGKVTSTLSQLEQKSGSRNILFQARIQF